MSAEDDRKAEAARILRCVEGVRDVENLAREGGRPGMGRYLTGRLLARAVSPPTSSGSTGRRDQDARGEGK